ncbi:magnesium transporter NIPA-domain-containing protein [Kockovaella imperatae]|uniref:Magnesium transporter NIPA-domain-containing protein n=1 Tax=Kockovaella imperatae TaxID=4999 RepID=A0A1Y1UHV1_9TREE|nr:magnesium transporter NIPA-domain-containing protein [Kockovaella imperatae]ORX37569.1 magnesium transporter NIPA-domain-containing protein [Kockovaella imperatae]
MTRIASVSTSSLIGVAIACGGNVLISLALTVQKLAHQRQNEELIASKSSSGRSSPDHDEPDVDPGPDYQSESSYHDEPSPTPSPKARIVEAVPVVVVPTTPGGEVPSTLIPSRAKGQETSRQSPSDRHAEIGESSKRRSSEEARETGARTDIRSLQLVPDPGPSHPRSRLPSPTPIRIPPRYKTDIDLSSNEDSGHIRKSDNDPSDRHRGRKRSSRHQSGEQKNKDEDKPEVEEGQYLKSKLWWLGMCLIAVGEGGNFLSYGFAPASVVAPLGTVALIANCIFAPLILRERFHAKELIGMGLAIVGAVTVVYSSNASNPRLDPDGLVHAIRQVPFIVYTCLNLVAMVILSLLSRSHKYGAKYIGIDVGVCALFGGYTVLSTKALSSLLSTIFLSAFASWITWVLVVVLIVTSVLQVKFLNRALMRFQSKEVIPTQFVFFSLAAIIGSAVLYQEFRDITPSSFINFVFGIATTFLGVHLLTSFSEEEEEPSDESTPDQSRATSPTVTYRPLPRAMPTNASLNVLLPSTSRISSHSNGLSASLNERTPLLVPIASPETLANGLSPGEGGVASLGRIKLVKKTSTGDFTPTLGLSSQAGFLLMATTPPSAPLPGNFGRRASNLRRPDLEEGRGRAPSSTRIQRGDSTERSSTLPG